MQRDEFRRSGWLGRAVCLLIVFLFVTGISQAEQLPIKTYTTADGLPRNAIQQIFSDSRGSLWFCTGDGLSFFNGYEFITYGLKDGLPHAYINDIIEDRSGKLWVATNGGGVCEFNPYADSPEARRFIIHQVGDSFSTNRVNVLYQDRAERIWAATDEGAFRLDSATGKAEFGRVEIQFPGATKYVVIFSFTEDREGMLWVGTVNGLARLMPDGRVFAYSYGSEIANARALLTDQEGRVWVSQDKGILVINPEPALAINPMARVPWKKLISQRPDAGESESNRSFILPQLPGEASLFKSSQNPDFNIVYDIAQAKNGRIWLGTTGGLGDFDGRRFNIYTIAGGRPPVNTLAEDRYGNLWFASREGVSKITLNSFTHFGENEGIKAAQAIFQDRAGNLVVIDRSAYPETYCRFEGRRFARLVPRFPPYIHYFGWGMGQMGFQHTSGEWWAATGEGLCRFPAVASLEDLARTPPKAVYTTINGLPANDIFQIFEDSRGDVWVSSYSPTVCLARWDQASETFQVYGKADGLPVGNGASAICEDAKGNLWIGFYEGGLARYAKGRFSFFAAADGLLGFRVKAMYVDGKDSLWIGTDTNGVARMDDTSADKPSFTYYTTDQGLATNNINSITEDKFGRLYVSHTRGVDRLTPETGAIRHYTAADGLSSEILSSFCDQQGTLWIGTYRGLYRLIPVPDESDYPPPIFINKLRIAGHDYAISKLGQTTVSMLELAAGQNQIEIGFFGLSFEAGESLRYEYKLEGAGQDWSSLSTQRFVNFASLAPGKYRFLVRAVNAAGRTSSEAAAIAFRIVPPIWQRWWFVALGGALVGLIAYTLYRYRVAHLLELERIRTRIATDLHDDIGANLSLIAMASEVAQRRSRQDDQQMAEVLSLISGTSRELVDSMGDIVWAVNPDRDHLVDLVKRMRRFASDVFSARSIAFHFEAPIDDRDIRLQTETRREVLLIFKEAVNNIAMHSECIQADIEFKGQGRWLVLTLKDNGKGFDTSRSFDGNGLMSMSRRAERLGGTLEIVSHNGGGTAVTLKTPLR